MFLARYVNELEMEGKDSHYPAIYGSGWLKIGVREHALDVTGVGLDDEITHS